MDESARSLKLLSLLLAFVFCGAIVGETVSLSMIVSLAGPQIISRLYLINGALLLLLPFFFFNVIDRFNRARIMCTLLWGMMGLLLTYLVVFLLLGGAAGVWANRFLIVIYPLSYLSKTILFLTFWTLANDIYSINIAKKRFPLIAAWGFVGGLCGAFIARLLLEVVAPEMILVLWIGSYSLALVFAYRIMVVNKGALLKSEDLSQVKLSRMGFLESFRDVFSLKLVPLLSVLYGLVFVAIFSIDFLFWKKCHAWFVTSRELASFQFAFYEVHGLVTVLGLWFIMPRLISSLGFIKIFYLLPIMLLSGSVVLIVGQLSGLNPHILLFTYVGIQFLRYIFFENAFSPVYQMFFTAIPLERRGRAKTVLEGVVKPVAIIIAGLSVLLLDRFENGLLIGIFVIAAIMIAIVWRLRLEYTRGLIPHSAAHVESSEIIAEIGSHDDQKILSLMKEYISATTSDLRILAVRIISHQRSKQAFVILNELFDREKDPEVCEIVAGSFVNFDWLDPRDLFDRFLSDHNPRIRANAIRSLNEMRSQWKWRFKDRIKGLLFDSNTRVQIEAAHYLWSANDLDDRHNVSTLLNYLLRIDNSNKYSAGIYLCGLLKPAGWETILLENLANAPLQVYTKCVEVIFGSAERTFQSTALKCIERLSRQHIAIAGKTLQAFGSMAVPLIVEYLKVVRPRRMMFELIHTLRIALDHRSAVGEHLDLDDESRGTITTWIMNELEQVYKHCFVFHCSLQSCGSISTAMLEDALRGKILRACEWVLDGLVIVDNRELLNWSYNDIDLHDPVQRMLAIEIIESASKRKIGALLVLLLRNEPWDVLARQAHNTFHFVDSSAVEGLAWFLRSSNRWVCLCSLYMLYRLHGASVLASTYSAALKELVVNSNSYCANAAEWILENKGNAMETFNLLETVFFFKTTVLFRNVAAEKLMGLAEASKLVNHPKDTVISREGDVAEHLYIVKSGSLKIVKIKNNIRVILSIIRIGEAYGEVGLFGHNPRSASAVANENCQLLVIQRESLKKQLMEMPEIAYNFLEIFSDKLRKSGEEVALLHTTLTHSLKETYAAK